MEPIGHGKIILFGEHFVVHGTPAIAAAIDKTVRAWVEPAKEISYEYNIDMTKLDPIRNKQAIKNVIDFFGLKGGLKVKADIQVPTFGGMGSSAAFCVALTKAVANYLKKDLTLEEINRCAYECEKAFHGNPSGIDNTVATFGGALWFRRGKEKNEIRRIPIKKPFYLTVGITGILADTKKMVSLFKEKMGEKPEEMKKAFKEMETIITEAENSLKKGDMEKLGELMNKNHQLLKIGGVVHEMNDFMNEIFIDAGALGAKLTGGGGGGCNIALAEDKQHAEILLRAIGREGFEGFVTKIE